VRHRVARYPNAPEEQPITQPYNPNQPPAPPSTTEENPPPEASASPAARTTKGDLPMHLIRAMLMFAGSHREPK